MEQYRAAGVEGLVAKGAAGRYEPGARRWLTYKTRELADVVIGGVTLNVEDVPPSSDYGQACSA